MQIKINESNEILYYASDNTKFDDMTAIDNSVVPENFQTDFKSKYFKFENGTIMVNTNYTAPVLPAGPGTSDTDKAVAALTLQIAENKAEQDTINAQLLLATAQQKAKETN